VSQAAHRELREETGFVARAGAAADNVLCYPDPWKVTLASLVQRTASTARLKTGLTRAALAPSQSSESYVALRVELDPAVRTLGCTWGTATPGCLRDLLTSCWCILALASGRAGHRRLRTCGRGHAARRTRPSSRSRRR
jgi:hypothetical protein